VSSSQPAFLSYAREDASFVLSLAKDLKAEGVNVWLDQLDIAPGRQWDRSVEEALVNCGQMLVVLSPAAVDSNNVMDEVAFALDERKAVIPLLHVECRVPFRLRRLQYVDFRLDYESGIRSLVSVLSTDQEAAAVASTRNDEQSVTPQSRSSGDNNSEDEEPLQRPETNEESPTFATPSLPASDFAINAAPLVSPEEPPSARERSVLSADKHVESTRQLKSAGTKKHSRKTPVDEIAAGTEFRDSQSAEEQSRGLLAEDSIERNRRILRNILLLGLLILVGLTIVIAISNR
jgi:hypothetical protein